MLLPQLFISLLAGATAPAAQAEPVIVDGCVEQLASVGVLREEWVDDDDLINRVQCSIVLVTERIGITAAHCLSPEGEAEGSALTAAFDFDPETFDFTTSRYVIETVTFGKRHDVALVLLDQPVTRRFYPEIRATPLRGNEIVSAQGHTLGATEHSETLEQVVMCSNWQRRHRGHEGDILQGHSGGPVLDSQGRLVGVVSSGAYIGATHYLFPALLRPLKKDIDKAISDWARSQPDS